MGNPDVQHGSQPEKQPEVVHSGPTGPQRPGVPGGQTEVAPADVEPDYIEPGTDTEPADTEPADPADVDTDDDSDHDPAARD
jgi:hypothetical protein